MSEPRFAAVVVGASAGAFEALSLLLTGLPADYALPVIIVVHLPADKRSMMAELIQLKCRLTVKEAEDKEPICAGTVYFAPPDYHLLVELGHTLALSSDEPVLYSRPSIDVLFETAADSYGPALIGIILTGANNDGAAGLKSVLGNGGVGLVQRPDTAYASAMPEAALKLCPTAKSMRLDQISQYLTEIVNP